MSLKKTFMIKFTVFYFYGPNRRSCTLSTPMLKMRKKSCVLCLFFISLGLFLAAPNTSQAKVLGGFQGGFEICRRPITVTKENLKQAYLHKKIQEKQVRLCALIEAKTFSEAQLQQFGWNIIYRIGDVVTLQGDRESAPYLEAIDGLHLTEPRWGIPIRSMCMDSARKLTRVNYVLGTAPSSLKQTYTGKNVLIGLIDTEFDIHHPDFLDAQGKTRFIALWDQVDSTATLRNGTSYGKIKSGALLNADTSFGLQGEFHGTLTASYAAGSDRTTPYYGMAPDAMIIGVKYDDNYVSTDVINGLNWIFHVADSLKVPCVVSLSIGEAVGPHDGTSLTDQAIDAVSTKAGHVVVGAIGNDGADKRHISFSLTSGQIESTWMQAIVDSIQNPQGATAVSGADFWGDSNKSFSANVYILDGKSMKYKQSNTISTTDKGPFLPDTIKGGATDSIVKQGDTLIFYTYLESKSPLNRKPHMEIEIVSNNPDLVVGISLSYLNNMGGTINGWSIVKKDFLSDSMPGFFEGDNISSLNEIGGTAKKIITIGAYCSKFSITTWNGLIYDRGLTIDTIYGKICNFSGRGPTMDGRIKPDISAPGDMVVGAMSRLAPDIGQTVIWPDTASTNGRYTRGTGTSVSSPIVAGAIALMFQAQPTLTVDAIRTILDSTTIKDQYTGQIAQANNTWGWGKLNAYGAVANLFGIIPVGTEKSGGYSLGDVVLQSTDQGRILFLNARGVKPKNPRIDLYSCEGRRVLSVNIPDNGLHLPQNLGKGVYFALAQSQGRVLVNRKIAVW
jgi:subtilisin family serine protease